MANTNYVSTDGLHSLTVHQQGGAIRLSTLNTELQQGKNSFPHLSACGFSIVPFTFKIHHQKGVFLLLTRKCYS